jgi:hypothetical protein
LRTVLDRIADHPVNQVDALLALEYPRRVSYRSAPRRLIVTIAYSAHDG